jgi:hypothetical protein
MKKHAYSSTLAMSVNRLGQDVLSDKPWAEILKGPLSKKMLAMKKNSEINPEQTMQKNSEHRKHAFHAGLETAGLGLLALPSIHNAYNAVRGKEAPHGKATTLAHAGSELAGLGILVPKVQEKLVKWAPKILGKHGSFDAGVRIGMTKIATSIGGLGALNSDYIQGLVHAGAPAKGGASNAALILAGLAGLGGAIGVHHLLKRKRGR